jgi:PAS domain S-box-containing protein
MEAQQAELLETENWFRSIIETAPDGMLVVEQSGTIVLSNPSVENIFGYDSGEMIGMNVDKLVPEAIRSGHGALRHQFAIDARARQMGGRDSLKGVRKDGAEVPVNVALSPLPERGNRGRCVSVSVKLVSA